MLRCLNRVWFDFGRPFTLQVHYRFSLAANSERYLAAQANSGSTAEKKVQPHADLTKTSAAFSYVFRPHKRKQRRQMRYQPLDIVMSSEMPDGCEGGTVFDIPSAGLESQSAVSDRFLGLLGNCQSLDDLRELVCSVNGTLSWPMLSACLELVCSMESQISEPVHFTRWYFSEDSSRFRHIIESSLDVQSNDISNSGMRLIVRFLLAAYKLGDTADEQCVVELLNRDFPSSLAAQIKRLPMKHLIGCFTLFHDCKPMPTHPIGQLVLQSLIDQLCEQFELRLFEIATLSQAGKLLTFLNGADTVKIMEKLEDQVLALLGTRVHPVRELCSLLAWYGRQRRRHRPVLTAILHQLSQSCEILDASSVVDSLLALSRLQLFDEQAMHKLLCELNWHLAEQGAFSHAKLAKLCSSLGQLRIRDEALFDQLWLHVQSTGSISVEQSFLAALASVHYIPVGYALPDTGLSPGFADQINNLWSLACLDLANREHFESLFQLDAGALLAGEGDGKDVVEMWKLACLFKLLQLHHYYESRYLGFDEPNQYRCPVKVEDISNLIAVKNKQLIGEVRTMLDEIGQAGELYKPLVVTKSGLVIDFLLIVNQDNEPQNLKFYIQRIANQKNKMIIPNHMRKVALKCVDFHDRTFYSGQYTGSTYLYKRMVELQGYRCAFVDRSVLSQLPSADDKRAYLLDSITSDEIRV